jgi:hypothetical protein
VENYTRKNVKINEDEFWGKGWSYVRLGWRGEERRSGEVGGINGKTNGNK